jgi:hypothetical protein
MKRSFDNMASQDIIEAAVCKVGDLQDGEYVITNATLF